MWCLKSRHNSLAGNPGAFTDADRIASDMGAIGATEAGPGTLRAALSDGTLWYGFAWSLQCGSAHGLSFIWNSFPRRPNPWLADSYSEDRDPWRRQFECSSILLEAGARRQLPRFRDRNDGVQVRNGFEPSNEDHTSQPLGRANCGECPCIQLSSSGCPVAVTCLMRSELPPAFPSSCPTGS